MKQTIFSNSSNCDRTFEQKSIQTIVTYECKLIKCDIFYSSTDVVWTEASEGLMGWLGVDEEGGREFYNSFLSYSRKSHR